MWWNTTIQEVALSFSATNQPGEVNRLLGLGAKSYPWRYAPDADYVVLEDPDGNLFCVVQIPEDRYCDVTD